MTDEGAKPQSEGLREVLTVLEGCLARLDQLDAGLVAVRLTHSIDSLRVKIAECDASERGGDTQPHVASA